MFYRRQANNIISPIHLKKMVCFQLSPIEDFPKQICEECRKKIEDIHQFRERVMQNEIKLIHYLNNNSLKSFFLQLANGVEVKDESIPKSNQMFKEEEESQDSNNFDVAYLAPHIITEIPQIRTVNELNLRNDKVLKKKSNPKTRIKQKPSNKKTKSQNVNRKVIRRDKYAEHDPNKCLTCFKLYDSSLDLSKHYKTDHSIEPGGLKPENDIEMTDKYTLHSQDGQKAFYKCNSCGDSKEDLEDIKKHVIQHKYERPFICKLCGKYLGVDSVS